MHRKSTLKGFKCHLSEKYFMANKENSIDNKESAKFILENLKSDLSDLFKLKDFFRHSKISLILSLIPLATLFFALFEFGLLLSYWIPASFTLVLIAILLNIFNKKKFTIAYEDYKDYSEGKAGNLAIFLGHFDFFLETFIQLIQPFLNSFILIFALNVAILFFLDKIFTYPFAFIASILVIYAGATFFSSLKNIIKKNNLNFNFKKNHAANKIALAFILIIILAIMVFYILALLQYISIFQEIDLKIISLTIIIQSLFFFSLGSYFSERKAEELVDIKITKFLDLKIYLKKMLIQEEKIENIDIEKVKKIYENVDKKTFQISKIFIFKYYTIRPNRTEIENALQARKNLDKTDL